MLTAIRDFFDKHLKSPEQGRDDRHAIALATAALLVEVVRMDGGIDAAEREVALVAVRTKFGLSAEEADTIVRLAEQEAREAHDYFQFTSLLNKHFSPEQKVRVIEHMWEVAYADAHLSAWEQHLVRKIAELLYVPHADYITAKLRARDAAGAR
jgi:uncharacterized tellurite resistance protein B-like protein